MYQVQLEEFEGPLDLLLFFIKRDELDIYDIPISRLTDQFIQYLHLMRELDLSVAAEFIWMASLLMSIKVKMMLPKPEEETAEGLQESDPRFELIQALLDYKRYKESAHTLRALDIENRKVYFRGTTEPDRVDWINDGEVLKNVTLIDLMAVIQQVLKNSSVPDVVHTIEKVKTSIEEQSQFLITHLKNTGRSSFIQLCRGLPGRAFIVVTFLAALELIRQQLISLHVDDDVMDFFLEAV